MKSIRKFRLTRQALKEVPADSSYPARREPGGNPGDDVDFPLGPRMFRRRQDLSEERQDHLTISEPSTKRRMIEQDEGRPAPNGESAEATASGSVLKIIHDEDLEKPAIVEDPAASGMQDVPLAGSAVEEGEKVTDLLQGQDSQYSGGPGAQPAGDSWDGPQPVIVPADPPPLEDGVEDAGAEPTAVQPAAEQEEGKNRRKAQSAKKAGSKASADRLSRYAMKVGSHSYVLIDDDGRLVKKSAGAKKK